MNLLWRAVKPRIPDVNVKVNRMQVRPLGHLSPTPAPPPSLPAHQVPYPSTSILLLKHTGVLSFLTQREGSTTDALSVLADTPQQATPVLSILLCPTKPQPLQAVTPRWPRELLALSCARGLVPCVHTA